MLLDLSKLRDMHPRLPGDVAFSLVSRAALGLDRHQHRPGVDLELDIERSSTRGRLGWPVADLSAVEQHDAHRITEDGAEAVALALAHEGRGWRVVRRMQREEHADWLLEYQDEKRRYLIALEVSGVDRGRIANRLRDKLAQVKEAPDVDQRWAGVVGFEKPAAALRSTQGA